MQIGFTQARWINPPARSRIDRDTVELVTEPGTDFWQRSYYGFRNDNAPATQAIAFGLYACSPTDSSFTATFTDFKLEPCRWRAHGAG